MLTVHMCGPAVVDVLLFVSHEAIVAGRGADGEPTRLYAGDR